MMTNFCQEVFYEKAVYPEGERLAETRHAYIGGKTYMKAGVGDAHVRILLNIAVLLKSHLRGTGCSTYISDMKVHMGEDVIFDNKT